MRLRPSEVVLCVNAAICAGLIAYLLIPTAPSKVTVSVATSVVIALSLAFEVVRARWG
jgi:hypothetical protein